MTQTQNAWNELADAAKDQPSSYIIIGGSAYVAGGMAVLGDLVDHVEPGTEIFNLVIQLSEELAGALAKVKAVKELRDADPTVS